MAYLQSGEIVAARNVWAGLVERSPPDAPWYDGLKAEVARLDDVYVHTVDDLGRIVQSGGPELALQLEAQGYAWIKDRVAPETAV